MDLTPSPGEIATDYPISGESHRRFHRLLDIGHPKACRYCGIRLVCLCDADSKKGVKVL